MSRAQDSGDGDNVSPVGSSAASPPEASESPHAQEPHDTEDSVGNIAPPDAGKTPPATQKPIAQVHYEPMHVHRPQCADFST